MGATWRFKERVTTQSLGGWQLHLYSKPSPRVGGGARKGTQRLQASCPQLEPAIWTWKRTTSKPPSHPESSPPSSQVKESVARRPKKKKDKQENTGRTLMEFLHELFSFTYFSSVTRINFGANGVQNDTFTLSLSV